MAAKNKKLPPKPLSRRKKYRKNSTYFYSAAKIAEAVGLTKRYIEKLRTENPTRYQVYELSAFCINHGVTCEMLDIFVRLKEEFRQFVVRDF